MVYVRGLMKSSAGQMALFRDMRVVEKGVDVS